IADNLSFAMRGLAASAVGVYSAFQLAGKSIGGLYAIVNAGAGDDMNWIERLSPGSAIRSIVKNWQEVETQTGIVVDDLESEIERAAGLIDRIMGSGQSGGDDGAGVERMKEMSEQLRKMREEARRAADAQKEIDDELKRQEGIQKQIEALQMQSELLGKSATEQALYKLELEGADDNQLALAESILATVDAYNQQIEAQEKAKQALAEQSSAVKAIEDSLRTQEDMIERSYQQRRDTILAYEKATGEDQTALLARLHEDRNE